VREALSGLTVRGRAFLAAGVTAVVCAILLGQPTLTRVGVLIAALPLLTALVLGRSRYRLALVRSVGPQTVTAGQPATVQLTMTNEGRTPSGVLMLEDHVPYVLGTRPRFVLDGIGHGWRRHATYQVRSDVRGRQRGIESDLRGKRARSSTDDHRRRDTRDERARTRIASASPVACRQPVRDACLKRKP